MDALRQLRLLYQHNGWADEQLLKALRRNPDNAAAWREYAHIIAVESMWMDRLLQRTSGFSAWPTWSAEELQTVRDSTAREYHRLLSKLDSAELDEAVTYINSAGLTFTSAQGEILLHVALHGQYHRGKTNLLLRQSGAEPAPVDFIGWARGVPAATEANWAR